MVQEKVADLGVIHNFLMQGIRSHTEGSKEMALPVNSDEESREWQGIAKKDIAEFYPFRLKLAAT